MSRLLSFFAVVLLLQRGSWGLDNGLALTPPSESTGTSASGLVSFRLLTEVCTIREYEVIQIIFMHNNGLGRHYTIVVWTPDPSGRARKGLISYSSNAV